MIKPTLLLIGAGGHARSCIDVVEQHGYYRIAGLIGMANELHSKHFGYEVIGTDNDLERLIDDHHSALIAIGQIFSSDNRVRIFQRLVKLGFQLPVIVSPSAWVSPHATIGIGTIIMHGAILNAGVQVGENCIVNTRTLLEHDVTLGNQCHVSTGAILNGNVSVGERSFIGSGSVIREGVVLGKSCFIGMGLSVKSNKADFTQIIMGD
jgi:sugar O-acyltransferase (sialic acid O-acetyltransferase NeuD family)